MMCQIRSGMDLTFGAEHEAFRREARRGWQRTFPLNLCPHFTPQPASKPTEPGKPPCSPTAGRPSAGPSSTAAGALRIMEWLVFEEEYHRARAPNG